MTGYMDDMEIVGLEIFLAVTTETVGTKEIKHYKFHIGQKHYIKFHDFQDMFSYENIIYRVSQKNVLMFWRAVAPLNFELGIKVRGVLELSGSQL